MKFNRRDVLLGLGAAGVAGGVAFGSGAFTTVEADRDVSVAVGSDEEDGGGLISIFGRFVEYEDGIAEINIPSDVLGAEGLNPDAETTLEEVATIRLEGGNQDPYTVTLDDADEEDAEGLTGDGLQFEINDGSDGTTEEGDAYALEVANIEPGNEVVLDIVITTDEGDEHSTLDGELNIKVESDAE